ncbi:MAG: ferritin-like domain-containing protein [Alphaproteobacteria bacterium]|nr:ferritin-like domain-containing protein [Alphaproteobacteria bacterium]
MSEAVDLGPLGLDRGGHLLIKRALRRLPVGGRLQVRGEDPHLALHLRAWGRAWGHPVAGLEITRGGAEDGRWRGAPWAGGLTEIVEHPDPRWGLAARGARVEAGGPAFDFPLRDKEGVWTEDAARLYAQAAANQWDPETAIDWSAPVDTPEEVEDAVVQVMTYLIENETAALLVPARFLARLHPHFREILQVLAIQVADEARHIEVFTRRAALRRPALGLSTTGGQASLKTLLDEPDFALASFLLSVLGEGSFLDLLRFLMVHAPDPVTRQVARLTSQDEARHVAFGVAHLTRHAERDPTLHARMADAVRRRNAALQHTAGLNEEVFDALVLLAAGSWAPEDVAAGWDRVAQLKLDMDRGRRLRLARLGFEEGVAEELSGLHVRNFM